MITVVKFIKSQDWFNPTFTKSIISWFIEVTEADGNSSANEKRSVHSLAEFFEVDKPFA